MSESRQVWIDRKTRAVMGVDQYLGRLGLVSEIGKSRSLGGHQNPDDWRDESQRLVAVEKWLSSGSEAEFLRHLSESPLIDEELRKLRGGLTLEEPSLFRIKKLLYHGEVLGEASPPHFDVDVEAVRRIRQSIHPQKKPGPRFRLVDELDPELAASRKSLETVKRSLRRLRKELEGEVLDAVTGKFDVRGMLRADGDIPDGLPLLEVPGGHVLWSKELEELEGKLESARTDVEDHEARVRSELSKVLAASKRLLVSLQEQLGDLDHRIARCRMRAELDGTWPVLSEDVYISVENGRSPRFADPQPVSFTLGNEPVVVLGPNMGGKSALLRMVGLAMYCGHHHLPFPADTMSFRWSHGVVYIGSEEPNAPALAEGLSAFGREVKRLVDCLKRPHGSLWLLDEVGRGTHPADGAKILSEVIAELARRGDGVLAASHFADIEVDGEFWRIKGIADPEILEAELGGGGEVRELLRRHMDYQPERVEAGASPPRDAWLIARALGLDLGDREGSE